MATPRRALFANNGRIADAAASISSGVIPSTKPGSRSNGPTRVERSSTKRSTRAGTSTLSTSAMTMFVSKPSSEPSRTSSCPSGTESPSWSVERAAIPCAASGNAPPRPPPDALRQIVGTLYGLQTSSKERWFDDRRCADAGAVFRCDVGRGTALRRLSPRTHENGGGRRGWP
jgi:hypothetical protein